jgi:hypothetical protein
LRSDGRGHRRERLILLRCGRKRERTGRGAGRPSNPGHQGADIARAFNTFQRRAHFAEKPVKTRG